MTTIGTQHLERPWSSAPAEVVEELRTDVDAGLTEQEARRRLEQGRNVLPRSAPRSLAGLVLEQLHETFIVVLLVAAVTTVVVGDLEDALIIALVVVLNTTLGVVQQRRAQRAIAALATLAPAAARVLRSGRSTMVPAEEVVVGDLLELQAGDLVPADGRLVQAEGLEVVESALTGESLPVAKTLEACPADSDVADRTSMLHGGTHVTRGRARAVVTTTGSGTQVGRLAHLLVMTAAPPTPLQVRLGRFGRQVAVVITGLCLLVLLLGLLRGEPLGTMVLAAISLAVAAVPESLPAVVVLSLAMGAQRMAARNAVVRTLPAVESLGSVTVIASDKTGTLTEGRMVVPAFWTPAGAVAVDGSGYGRVGELHGSDQALAAGRSLLRAAVLCNDAQLVRTGDGQWEVAGDPMEGALLSLAAKAGLATDELREQWPRVAEYGFDHDRARMTTIHRAAVGPVLSCCKGAPEVVLALVEQGPQVTAARREVDRMTADGLRVLAVAEAELPTLPRTEREAEGDLRLLGLLALHDPPRAAAAAAVAACRAAGVRPIMITGDHPTTAAAIARQLGILDDDGLVTTGREAEQGLDRRTLHRTRVYARTAPEQKLAIVEALRADGQVVAMTGDGVNDAPALRRADIGVAMGKSGTDVARQAADMILADDDFATIVEAVAEGRRVYDNVRRFLLYGLSGGLAEVLLMLGGPFVGLPLPLLPGQILWVNMLTHGLPGVALGAELPEDDVLENPPRDPAEGVLGGGLLGRIAPLAALMGTVALLLGVWADGAGRPWQSMVFVTLTLQQLGVALALRSQVRSLWSVGLRGNPLLLGSLVLNLGLLWLAVAWPPLRTLLGTSSLSGQELAICLLVSLAAPVAVELGKARNRWTAKRA